MFSLFKKQENIVLFLRLTFLAVAALATGHAYANGNCTGPSGGTNNLVATLGNFAVTNPEDNVAG